MPSESLKTSSRRARLARDSVTVAVLCASWAWAAASEARERVTWSLNFEASSSTSTWPALTRSFTSTSTRLTVPESSLPTLTERVGCSVPLADTLSVRLPLRSSVVT